MSRLMSLSGVKRTCLLALHMSAFDPKRTSGANTSHPVVALVHGYFSDFFTKRLLALGLNRAHNFRGSGDVRGENP